MLVVVLDYGVDLQAVWFTISVNIVRHIEYHFHAFNKCDSLPLQIIDCSFADENYVTVLIQLVEVCVYLRFHLSLPIRVARFPQQITESLRKNGGGKGGDKKGTFYLFCAPRIASVQNMVTTTTL